MFLSFSILCLPFSSPLLSPTLFLALNKSFVGAEMRDNFTSKCFSYCHFCNLKALMHFKKRPVFALERRCSDSVVGVWAEVHERWIITPHFVPLCKMIMAGACQAVRWCSVFPRVTSGRLLKGSETVRKESAFVWISLEGVSRTGPPPNDTFCTPVGPSCGFARTLQNLPTFQGCTEQPRIQSSGAESQRCWGSGRHGSEVQQNHISHGAERTSTPSRIPNAVIARRLALINISPTLAFVPSPLS